MFFCVSFRLMRPRKYNAAPIRKQDEQTRLLQQENKSIASKY